MGKTVDRVLLILLAASVFFALFFSLTKSLVLSLLCSFLTIGILFFASKCIKPKTPKDLLSKRDFIRYVLLNGNNCLKTLVESSFSEKESPIDREGNTIIEGSEGRALIYYAYKFGSLSEEDIAKAYRIARDANAQKIYALTNHAERKALAVTEYIPQTCTIVGASTLYKYLLKRSLIPPKSVFMRKKSRTANLFRAALDRGNVKYYCIAGLSTSLLSLLSPLKTYYMIFSFLNLALAIVSLIFSEKNCGECEIFKR